MRFDNIFLSAVVLAFLWLGLWSLNHEGAERVCQFAGFSHTATSPTFESVCRKVDQNGVLIERSMEDLLRAARK